MKLHRNRILFLDTEFTGFDINEDHLVQVAWVMTDLEGNVLKNATYMVRPEGYEIPEESTAIHHINTEQAATYGYPIKVVMEVFRSDLLKCCCCVGYSLYSDLAFIKKAWKESLEAKYPYWPTIDLVDYEKTVRELLNYEEDSRTISLATMYLLLFGESMTRAHNAMNDAMATCRCFWRLVELGVIDRGTFRG